MVDAVSHALMITGFVAMMMLVVEYLNVLTGGAWRQRLAVRGPRQYVLAAMLGTVPGCLGAFAVVAMYSHGAVTRGAVVAAMIATSGDEAFVMLAMIPAQALALSAILFVFGVAAGLLVDRATGQRRAPAVMACGGLEVHAGEPCECFPRGRILAKWKQCSPARGTLGVTLALFLAAVWTGRLGPPEWSWIRLTLMLTTTAALFIVVTVPDHFLERHLWEHVAHRHVPRIFLWTLGALIAVHFLRQATHLNGALHGGKWLVLLASCLIGLIPESGPHLIFVTLFAQGAVPFSVLLANSIVQDGHGMLPMLAHSRAEFLSVKGINFCAGLLAGAAAMSIGI